MLNVISVVIEIYVSQLHMRSLVIWVYWKEERPGGVDMDLAPLPVYRLCKLKVLGWEKVHKFLEC